MTVNPKNVGDFMGLAARHIRFQVLDMLRKSKSKQRDDLGTIIDPPDPSSNQADDSELWICFYEAIEGLPKEEQTVADMLWTWVEGKGGRAVPNLTQYEAAEVLGISRNRVKDLWRNAKIKIARNCKDFNPFNG